MVLRKRINSTGEALSSGYASVLNTPSRNLRKIMRSLESQHFGGLVMSFVTQVHDLDFLTAAMIDAITKAVCRVYGMQVGYWIRFKGQQGYRCKPISLPPLTHVHEHQLPNIVRYPWVGYRTRRTF